MNEVLQSTVVLYEGKLCTKSNKELQPQVWFRVPYNKKRVHPNIRIRSYKLESSEYVVMKFGTNMTVLKQKGSF